MGSTGEADRKRRHFSSISPTAASAKKHTFVPLSEEKKLDVAVLKFQNQKLMQKLETQKAEITGLADRLSLLKDKQKFYAKTLDVVNNSWEELLGDMESRSKGTKVLMKRRQGFEVKNTIEDGDSPPEDAFLSRLLETGATESCSTTTDTKPMEIDRQTDGEKAKSILRNLVATLDDLSGLKVWLYAASLEAISSCGLGQRVVPSNCHAEVRNLRIEVLNLHVKHKSLAGELQRHRDNEAMNKFDLKRLRGELESTIADLEENNRKLAILKAERDVAKETFFPVLNRGNKQPTSEKVRDKQKDLHDMESTLKELLDQSSSRLHDLKHLHEDRLDILRQLSILQSNLKNLKFICSSQAYLLLKDQLAKTKADVVHYQALYEQLQVEKDALFWRERENHMKSELIDVLQQSSAFADSRISDLETEIRRFIKEKTDIETKLEDALKEPGRKEVIAAFKALVSSFPEKMGSMQNHLIKHKEAASDVHCLRADVQSLTNILDCKVKDLESYTARSAQQKAEIQKLKAVVHDLELIELDLKLFVEMYGKESTDSREVTEAKNSEIKAWARVQSLKSSLDEHNLELRVKVAIEAEAKAQQRLAASETEIADLRQKLDASKREKSRLSDVVKSKHEETETYLSEIETIGQAYDDMQTQNQQLLHQITERDDYNVKLFLEGVQARHTESALLMEKQTLEQTVQQTKTTIDLYDLKAGRIEDQLKAQSDQIQRLTEDRVRNATNLENIQKKLSDTRKSSQQLMDILEVTQSRVDDSRKCLTGLQIELEKERFERKRVEEDIETLRIKVKHLKLQPGSSTSEKLQQELKEYVDILKCGICLDRRKEVVITKCYHLFCNPCVQRVVETRHRKCPVCAASFGANDVRPVYI
ncbi:E3 ubiquitin-protein ligase BRE1-like 1 isoform X1 [Primulina eburnea]|uniref:E3 ubiquitin-protein ligase BRE1-like 1 isoform X1 n=2 Tax=Primulina eburnea TaxID=1245227 RepID=UPI003C6BD99F